MNGNNLTQPLWGGIEGGGTKFNCIVAASPDQIIAETRIPTTTPGQTLQQVTAFFQPYLTHGLAGIGFACFGPLDLNPQSPTFGYLTATPKPGWTHTDLLTPLHTALGLPVTLDTDVNGAALGEQRWGAAQQVDSFIYLTVGTGIGGGLIMNGKRIHGLTHPEMGHIRIPHNYQQDPFPGSCPFHQDCFEGLASGPAIEKRWGQPAETLSPQHPAWALEAEYIALALVNYITTLSPQKIILGGGVMNAEWLFPLVRTRVQELLNDYIAHPAITANIDSFIVPPALGVHSGVLGAVGLAMQNADK